MGNANFCPSASRISTHEELRKVHGSLDTGDLLLFRSVGAAGFFTRCCTNTSWDHVAVVTRRTVQDGPRVGPTPDHKFKGEHRCDPEYCTCVAEAEDLVEIVEATAAGVHVYGLDDRLAKTLSHHEYVAVLKAHSKPTPEQQFRLEQLIKKLRGRAYEPLQSGDLCHACCVRCCGERSKSNLRETQEWTERQQEQLFCSELAANCLAALGTLKLAAFDVDGDGLVDVVDVDGHEARSFLPSDFCDETGGSREIWFESITSDDPYAPVVMLQYPGSPYESFLASLKKQLWEDHEYNELWKKDADVDNLRCSHRSLETEESLREGRC